jgi:hypothetical protein
MNRPLAALAIAACALAAGAANLRAQAGPPMITDDPGTTPAGHWTINTAWTDQRTPGSTLTGLPLVDANYGATDRIELNYEASWNIERDSGGPAASGISDSEFSVKWRFLDHGEQSLQVSTAPRLFVPGSGSDPSRPELTDPHTSFLLPIEIARDFSALSVGADLGHTFSRWAVSRGWMGGICLGRDIRKGWDIDAEIHVTTSENVAQIEATANLGTRYELGEHFTLLLSAGRDVRNTLTPKASLLTYAGVQVCF